MMNSHDWIRKAMTELNELTAVPLDDPADAWRALVLMARLVGSPIGPKPLPTTLDRVPELLGIAGLPEPQVVLDALADELASDEEPWGPLLGALLDTDDTLAVLTLTAHSDAARALTARAAGLLSLYPERTVDLGAFSEMRLQTVREESAIAALWRTVERAPAMLLAEALPEQEPSRGDEIASLAFARPWFEAIYLQVHSAISSLADEVRTTLQPAGLRLNFGATLGEPKTIEAELVWGEVRRLDVARHATVNLPRPENCQLWYATSEDTMLLEESAWKLEHGESPVFIAATESTGAQSLEEALAEGSRAAGLVLVEIDGAGEVDEQDN